MKTLEAAIVDLECRLGLKPGQPVSSSQQQQKKKSGGNDNKKKKQQKQKQKQKKQPAGGGGPSPEELAAQPEICKLELKVGVITKVWNHPGADKLYCEEIDVGEPEPRSIASGLRPHFTLEEMTGRRLLVVANLKAKNLQKFKSHGMVLCAVSSDGGESETVEFVEPPPGANPGDRVTFEGLADPMPLAPSQIEKKKVFRNCLEGLTADADGIAAWNGHRFVVASSGDGDRYCRTATIRNGSLR